MRDGGGVDEFILRQHVSDTCSTAGSLPRTGTFFCEITTAQSLPRTPNDVMLAAVIALKAYSA